MNTYFDILRYDRDDTDKRAITPLLRTIYDTGNKNE